MFPDRFRTRSVFVFTVDRIGCDNFLSAKVGFGCTASNLFSPDTSCSGVVDRGQKYLIRKASEPILAQVGLIPWWLHPTSNFFLTDSVHPSSWWARVAERARHLFWSTSGGARRTEFITPTVHRFAISALSLLIDNRSQYIYLGSPCYDVKSCGCG